MSSEKISLIILIFSFLGLIILILRKMPILVSLPKNEEVVLGTGFFSKIKSFPVFKSFSFEVFLQRIISRIRVLSLKTDHKTFHWLKKLREKNQKDKLENGSYWEQIKNSTDQDKNMPT